MASILNSSSGLYSYVVAACKPCRDHPNQLKELVSATTFSAGDMTLSADGGAIIRANYTENLFNFTQIDIQNDGVIIAIDWTPGAHTQSYSGSTTYRLLSIRNQASDTGNTVEMISNSTNGYTNDFFISLASSTVKNTNVDPNPTTQTRQISYIHYKPGTRVFSLVNDGTEEDTYTLPSGAFNVDRVLVGGGRPDDRIFGWLMLRKSGSDFSAAEVTELEDRFQYAFKSTKKYLTQFRLN